MLDKKRILITAGPTWVAIDRVRVISNVATGQTGIILAEKFKKLKIPVTLLLGPGNNYESNKFVKVIRFKYFSELAQLLKKELTKNKYSAVIHSAAVTDYRPDSIINTKVSSHFRSWKLNLVPTEKLINSLRDYDSKLAIVGFKFEPQAAKLELIQEGRKLLKQARLDFVVANSRIDGSYCAHIIDKGSCSKPYLTKLKMAEALVKLLR